MCDTVLAKGEIFLKENAFCHTRMTLNCADHCKRNDETLTPFPSQGLTVTISSDLQQKNVAQHAFMITKYYLSLIFIMLR